MILIQSHFSWINHVLIGKCNIFLDTMCFRKKIERIYYFIRNKVLLHSSELLLPAVKTLRVEIKVASHSDDFVTLSVVVTPVCKSWSNVYTKVR